MGMEASGCLGVEPRESRQMYRRRASKRSRNSAQASSDASFTGVGRRPSQRRTNRHIIAHRATHSKLVLVLSASFQAELPSIDRRRQVNACLDISAPARWSTGLGQSLRHASLSQGECCGRIKSLRRLGICWTAPLGHFEIVDG